MSTLQDLDTTRAGRTEHLAVPGSQAGSRDPSTHRIKNLPGYTTPVFKGKEEQRALVETEVAAKVRALIGIEGE